MGSGRGRSTELRYISQYPIATDIDVLDARARPRRPWRGDRINMIIKTSSFIPYCLIRAGYRLYTSCARASRQRTAHSFMEGRDASDRTRVALTLTLPPRIVRSCSSCPLIFPLPRGPHSRGGLGSGTTAAHVIAPPGMAALRERCESRKSLHKAVAAIPQQ